MVSVLWRCRTVSSWLLHLHKAWAHFTGAHGRECGGTYASHIRLQCPHWCGCFVAHVLSFCLPVCSLGNAFGSCFPSPKDWKWTFVATLCDGSGGCIHNKLVCVHVDRCFFWRKADAAGMLGQQAEATKYYERAAGLLPQSEELLYNYAADLNVMGNCRESQEVLKRLSLLLNDYDTELLSADNAENLGQTSLSITHLQKAHAMVPNRFFPLWSQFVIEQKMGHWQRAGQLAREIVGKKVKVPSADVEQMRGEAAAWLREQRRSD